MKDYIYLIVPFTSLIIAQLIKFTFESISNKRLEWGRLFNGSGGMPSTHTSFSFSLVMTIGYLNGFTSPLFALGLIFCFIVSYDAMGVRYESGKQAEQINEIQKNIGKKNFKALKEKIGHEPLEVLMGFCLGLCTSTIFVTILLS